MDLLDVRKGLRGPSYLTTGVALFLVKFGIDCALARLLGRSWSVLDYLSPRDSPLLKPGEDPVYWLAMWGVALPFIAIGLILTLRRLRDAGMPLGLALLFFIPFLNLLFFLVCSLLPSRPAATRAPEGSHATRASPASHFGFGTTVGIAGVSGAAVGLGGSAVSILILGAYGAALLIGTPVMAGFVTAVLFHHLHGRSKRGIALSVTAALVLAAAVAVAFSLEGLICILMAAPLVILGTVLGALLGFRCGRMTPPGTGALAGSLLTLLPLTMAGEAFLHLRPADPAPVTTAILVRAPASLVWRRVIQFPPLSPAREWIFQAGVAAPTGATISGCGVGAIRRCHFTTGDFREPILIWNPGRELSFRVESMPDPLRELTLGHGPRPPHLDGYLESTRGQFDLETLPGGRTRLIGRTWYRTHLFPEAYWRLWADPIIHAIHRRVLEHVARLAEADALEERLSSSSDRHGPGHDGPAAVR